MTSQHVFTHEIGHLLGGQHSGHHNGADDGYVNATFWPALLEANILGYTNATANGFRTLMGNETGGGTACTFVTGCPRINRWSSPIFSAVLNGVSQPLGRSFVDPLGTARTTDMVKSLGGYVDLVTGTGSSGTIRLVAGNRIPNTAVPGIVSNVAAGVCNSTLNVTWASPAGTVGWYQWGRTSVAVLAVLCPSDAPRPGARGAGWGKVGCPQPFDAPRRAVAVLWRGFRGLRRAGRGLRR